MSRVASSLSCINPALIRSYSSRAQAHFSSSSQFAAFFNQLAAVSRQSTPFPRQPAPLPIQARAFLSQPTAFPRQSRAFPGSKAFTSITSKMASNRSAFVDAPGKPLRVGDSPMPKPGANDVSTQRQPSGIKYNTAAFQEMPLDRRDTKTIKLELHADSNPHRSSFAAAPGPSTPSTPRKPTQAS